MGITSKTWREKNKWASSYRYNRYYRVRYLGREEKEKEEQT